MSDINPIGGASAVRRICATLALTLAARLAHAAGDRDPLSQPLRNYALVLAMSLLGGFAGWYAKVRKGEVPGASLFALIGEMATSALAGLGAFFVCDHLDVAIGLTAAAAGLCGYMGGRAIELGEKWLQRRIDRAAEAP